MKIEKILFYLFLFLIPFQIRYFLHNNGNEWNSAFLYLGDLLFIVVLGLALLRKGIKIGEKDILLLIFLIISAVSLFVTSGLSIGAFRLVKLLEFALLYIYICSNAAFLGLNKALSIIFYSGVLQAILAIAQFIKQGSIGIKFVEAGVFSPDSPGVANFILNGERIMRSYGSFSHPNVLAGFLVLAGFCFYGLFLQRDIQGESKGNQRGLVNMFGFLIIVFALFLTFSRTAIAVFGATTTVFFLIEFLKTREKQIIKLFGLFVISCILATIILFPYIKARFFTISLEEQAVDLRFFYNKMTIQMIKEKPILGIGIGNFVNHSQNYPAYLRAAAKISGVFEGSPEGINGIPQWIFQPVHNIYLLIAAEIGIIGLVAFLGFIGLALLKGIQGVFEGNQRVFMFLVLGFLIIGLADHYFWTLQAGGLMFWFVLALTAKE